MKPYLHLLAVLLLLSLQIPDRLFAQCGPGYTSQTLNYTQTAVNTSGSQTTYFSIPRIPASAGTLTSVVIRSYATIKGYTYSVENSTASPVTGYLKLFRYEELTSPDLSDSWAQTRSYTGTTNTLAPNDGVTGSGADYYYFPPTDIWPNQIILNVAVVTGLAEFIGTGNINFELNSDITNAVPAGWTVSNTQFTELSMTFSVTYNYCEQLILPGDFTTFSAAKMDDKKYSLLWEMPNEITNRNYSIESSNDGGKTFVTVAYVEGQGQANGKVQYHYEGERNETDAKLLFRIVQEDPNGKRRYSEIKPVLWDPLFTNVFTISPNPAKDRVHLDFGGLPAGTWTVQLIGMDGRVLQQQQLLHSGNNDLYFQLAPQIRKGFYLLKAVNSSGDKPISSKLFVDR